MVGERKCQGAIFPWSPCWLMRTGKGKKRGRMRKGREEEEFGRVELSVCLRDGTSKEEEEW